MNDEYTLYLDESEVTNTHHFAISGVIIKNSVENEVKSALDVLKQKIWEQDANATNYVLHEMEVSKAKRSASTSLNSVYGVFHISSKRNALYNGLSKILKDYELTTIGTCIIPSELNALYPGDNPDRFKIAFQMLLENYCHFLLSKNATGKICYESRGEDNDAVLRHRYYEILTLGSLYYTSNCFQSHIVGLEFISKTDNNTGLQLADFIPNTHARSSSNLKAKNDNFKKRVFANAYDGTISKREKYGLKIIP